MSTKELKQRTMAPASAPSAPVGLVGPIGPVGPVVITTRLKLRCGEVDLASGAKLAEVRLEPGVSLNYMIDAIRGGLAGDVDPIQ